MTEKQFQARLDALAALGRARAEARSLVALDVLSRRERALREPITRRAGLWALAVGGGFLLAGACMSPVQWEQLAVVLP